MENRFDLYGAIWKFCSDYHSGQSSRGYRILSRLDIAGYNPGLSLQSGHFETLDQKQIYRYLVKTYKDKI